MVKRINNIFRFIFALLGIIIIIYVKEFYQHFYAYLTGGVITQVITQQWHIVAVSIAVFLAFLIPLSFRRKANWVEYGLVSAFFVSLFVEMYGIPLTILFASKYFLTSSIVLPPNIINFSALGISFGMDLPMLYGLILIFLGMTLIIIGWVTLYKNIKKDDTKKSNLVIKGIYAYSRHPQYLGFILLILGWFIGWPTILTLLFAPILIYKYIRAAKNEESEFLYSMKYKKYKKKVPFFV